eukprot:4402859-Amphidinium_carterae.1
MMPRPNPPSLPPCYEYQSHVDVALTNLSGVFNVCGRLDIHYIVFAKTEESHGWTQRQKFNDLNSGLKNNIPLSAPCTRCVVSNIHWSLLQLRSTVNVNG